MGTTMNTTTVIYPDGREEIIEIEIPEPEPDPEPTTDEILNAMLGVTTNG